jgi:type IV secretion system protein VirD4
VAASRVVWGQIVVVFAIVLFAVWMATQWTAWRLGFQPQLGSPWFSLAWVCTPRPRSPARTPTSRRRSSVHDSTKRGA